MRNTHLHGLGFALLLSLTLVSTGCFGGPVDNGGGTDGGTATDGGSGGTPCQADADCSATQVCSSSGTCVDKCQGVICGNQVCDNTSGSCVDCLSDTDCTNGTCDTATHTCKSAGGGGKGAACTGPTSCNRGQVCDNGTCQPGAYGDCSSLQCATGLDCMTFTTSQGTAQFCLQACSSTTDCSDPTNVCDTGSGDAAQNHCVQNYCGPGLPSGSQGPVWAGPADFMGPCNAAGTNDGTCWGPVGQTSGFQLGLCFANGQVAPGGSCDVTASYSNVAQMCNGGYCLGTSQTSTAGVCFALCSVADGQSCANDPAGNPTACWAPPGNELAGVCFPQDAAAGATGATCTPFSQSHQSLSCVSDDECVAGGTSGSCVQLCNRAATTTTCPSGTTCQADAANDALKGNCK